MQNVLHLILYLRISRQHIQSKQILLQVQVKIRLQVSKTNSIVKHIVLNLTDIGFALYQDVPVQIVYDIVQLFSHDLLHINLDLRLEIVKPVQESTDISLQRPASIRNPEPQQQIPKRIPFLEFTHIHSAFVVNQALQNLEVSDQIQQLRIDHDSSR